MKVKIWKNSIKGLRPQNEDLILYNDMGRERHLCLIADGIGGYSNGKNAAELVGINISAFLESQKKIDEHTIQIAINKANLLLRQAQEAGAEKAGTTLGGIYIHDQSAIIFWVGDVKIYHIKNECVQFENREHSLIMRLKERGITIDLDKASRIRHMITNSIQGNISIPHADFCSLSNLEEGDLFVLCSDGFRSSHFNNLHIPVNIMEKARYINSNNDDKQDDSSIAILLLATN